LWGQHNPIKVSVIIEEKYVENLSVSVILKLNGKEKIKTMYYRKFESDEL